MTTYKTLRCDGTRVGGELCGAEHKLGGADISGWLEVHIGPLMDSNSVLLRGDFCSLECLSATLQNMRKSEELRR